MSSEQEREKAVWAQAFQYGFDHYAKTGGPGPENHSAIAAQYADKVLKEFRNLIRDKFQP